MCPVGVTFAAVDASLALFAARVAAVAPEQDDSPWGGGRRFEDLSPRAFFDPWPDGELSPPAEFDAYPFTDDQHRDALLRALELYRDVVIDYRYYVSTSSRDRVASRTGVSPSTLSKFNNGQRFPRVETYLVLRAFLPEHSRTLRDHARRLQLADEKWADQEVQRRLAEAVQQAVEAELRRQRPRRR